MKNFLSASQIARLEDVAPATVVRWIQKGVFPGTRKVGNSYRIPIADYHAWREQTKVINKDLTQQTVVRTAVRTNAP